MAQEKINNVVGDPFEELNTEDMQQAQGAGDVDAESTPAAVSFIVSVSAGVAVSVTKCGD